MADQSDTLRIITGMIAAAVYPDGTGQASVVAAGVRIYPGWPNAAQLDNELRAGQCHVTVFPLQAEKNVTRHNRDWRELARATRTITAEIDGDDITLGGTVSSPQNVTAIVDGKAYSYGVQPADTLTGIAAALAALISVDRAASSTGAVLTPPAGYGIKVNIGVNGTMARELRRSEKRIQVTVWAPTPELREALCKIIDPLLAEPDFLFYPDGTAGRIVYVGSHELDSTQKEILYRRDMLYTAELVVIGTTDATEVTVVEEHYAGSQTGAEDVPIGQIVIGG